MSSGSTRPVDCRVRNGVALITLNRPPENRFAHDSMRDLDEAILAARFDDTAHVLVLRGAGEEYFSAGADLNMLRAVTPEFRHGFFLHASETFDRLERTPKLVIAALNGHALGGGLELALAADLRVARQGAGTVGLPDVGVGVMPGSGGTRRLARLVNRSRVVELLVTGESLGFERALELGLVNRVWAAASAEEFVEQVIEYARGFCPPRTAAGTVGAIKRAVQAASLAPWSEEEPPR